MNIVEALKLSNKIKGTFGANTRTVYFCDHISAPFFTHVEITSNNWEPVFEKKTVTKKFYQAVLWSTQTHHYYISNLIFETPEKAEEHCKINDFTLVRFLVENPIEVEVEG